MPVKLIGAYENGNYTVRIYEDGTKIRENDLDNLTPAFPESIDIKITNMCDMGCPMCHEDSKPDGKHGNIMGLKFVDSLRPYTELAIGGGNPLSHPDLEMFLTKLRDRGIIANMTVNIKHFVNNIDLLRRFRDEKLVHGLGISMNEKWEGDIIPMIREFPNAVVHVIAGIVTMEVIESLAGLKVLILGYKTFRRGAIHFYKNLDDINENIRIIRDNMGKIIKICKVVSFDNLAIYQLNLKRTLLQMGYDEAFWNRFYMGDDGQYTMYIDMVNEKFAKNSTSEDRFDLLDEITDMFKAVH